MNGSYTLQVPLIIAGTYTFEVKLVVSLNGIVGMIDFTSMQNHKGHIYSAKLQINETVECNIDLILLRFNYCFEWKLQYYKHTYCTLKNKPCITWRISQAKNGNSPMSAKYEQG